MHACLTPATLPWGRRFGVNTRSTLCEVKTADGPGALSRPARRALRASDQLRPTTTDWIDALIGGGGCMVRMHPLGPGVATLALATLAASGCRELDGVRYEL